MLGRREMFSNTPRRERCERWEAGSCRENEWKHEKKKSTARKQTARKQIRREQEMKIVLNRKR